VKIKRKDLNLIIKECLSTSNSSRDLNEAIRTGGGFEDYGSIENCDFSQFDDKILALIFATPKFLLLSEEEKKAFNAAAKKHPNTMSSFDRIAPSQRKMLNRIVNIGMGAGFGVLAAGMCSMINDLSKDIREFLESIGFFEEEEVKLKDQPRTTSLETRGFIDPINVAIIAVITDHYQDIKTSLRSWTETSITDLEVVLFPNFHEQLGSKGIADAITAYSSDIDTIKEKIDNLERKSLTSQEEVLEILFDKPTTFSIGGTGKDILREYKASNPDKKAKLEESLSVIDSSDYAHELIKNISIAKEKFDAKYIAKGLLPRLL
jgi:hypothetical protein